MNIDNYVAIEKGDLHALPGEIALLGILCSALVINTLISTVLSTLDIIFRIIISVSYFHITRKSILLLIPLLSIK